MMDYMDYKESMEIFDLISLEVEETARKNGVLDMDKISNMRTVIDYLKSEKMINWEDYYELHCYVSKFAKSLAKRIELL